MSDSLLLYRCPACLVGQRKPPGYYMTCLGCGKQSLLMAEGHETDCSCATCKLVRRQTGVKLARHEWAQVKPVYKSLVIKHRCRCGLVKIQDPDAADPRYHRDGYEVIYHPVCTI